MQVDANTPNKNGKDKYTYRLRFKNIQKIPVARYINTHIIRRLITTCVYAMFFRKNFIKFY